jgi:hypothetical protein
LLQLPERATKSNCGEVSAPGTSDVESLEHPPHHNRRYLILESCTESDRHNKMHSDTATDRFGDRRTQRRTKQQTDTATDRHSNTRTDSHRQTQRQTQRQTDFVPSFDDLIEMQIPRSNLGSSLVPFCISHARLPRSSRDYS